MLIMLSFLVLQGPGRRSRSTSQSSMHMVGLCVAYKLLKYIMPEGSSVSFVQGLFVFAVVF